MNRTIKNSDTRFLPVLLGTDANCYGMARAFHEAYGIKSLALGKFPLLETRKSRIVEVHTHPDFDKAPTFLSTLDDVASLYKGYYDALLLIACGDRYTELVCEHKEELSKRFVIPYIDHALKLQLENKADFYDMCDRYGLPYPATHIVTAESQEDLDLPFDFPVALKASNSIEWLEIDFPGKKKAFKVDSPEELQDLVHKSYAAGYTDKLIIQDFIPGGDDAMYVLNSYSNDQGKVQMMCLGHCLLEDHTPAGVGNYNAILQEGNDDLYKTYQRFLEAIGFIGFANFDLKYDTRDGQYKVFEINIRQGRSSYFTTASGCNLATWLVRDRVEGIHLETPHYHNNPTLWLHVPVDFFLDYVPKDELPRIRRLINEGRVSNTLLYEKDLGLYRRLMINRFYHGQRKRMLT